jgi:hypothetical protein
VHFLLDDDGLDLGRDEQTATREAGNRGDQRPHVRRLNGPQHTNANRALRRGRARVSPRLDRGERSDPGGSFALEGYRAGPPVERNAVTLAA